MNQLFSAKFEARNMGSFKQTFAALAITGILFMTVSCSSPELDDQSTLAEEKVTTATGCTIEGTGELGDVVALEEVTDEYGTYCHVTVSPEAKDGYLTLATAPNGAELEAAGFTDEDLIKAQDIAYKIAVEETLDGSRLDNNTQTVSEWYKETMRDKLAPGVRETYDNYTRDYPDENAGIVITGVFDDSPLIRDGQPRVESVSIKTSAITPQKVAEGATQEAGSDYLLLSVDYAGLYRASDESIISNLKKSDPSLTDEAIKADNPDLFDEDPNSRYALASTQTFAFNKASEIIGASMTYSLFTYSATNTLVTKE